MTRLVGNHKLIFKRATKPKQTQNTKHKLGSLKRFCLYSFVLFSFSFCLAWNNIKKERKEWEIVVMLIWKILNDCEHSEEHEKKYMTWICMEK